MKNFRIVPNLFLAAFLAGLGAGCAGQEASRNTARVLVGQMSKLETETLKAVKAEENYYQAASQILGVAVSREARVKENEAIDRAAKDFARSFLNSKNSVTDADIRDFLEKDARQIWDIRKETLAKGHAEVTALADGLRKLEVQTESLRSARKIFEELQKEPSSLTQGEELYDWTKKVLGSVTSTNAPANP